MNIGTAKPTLEEQSLLPHHLLDLISPRDTFSVTQYAERARALIEKIQTPLLVGGTGLYLQALSLPMDFGTAPGDEKIREKYHAIAETQGNASLHALLQKCDPKSAEKLHPNDVRRVVRALEVFELTGTPFSAQQMPTEEESPYDFQLYALDWPREILYERVDQRVLEMIRAGLLQEVEQLLDSGVSPQDQSMQGLGYKELIPVLKKQMTLAEAVSLIQLRTRHYAKRQLTWFKRDGRIHWLPVPAPIEQMCERICKKFEE